MNLKWKKTLSISNISDLKSVILGVYLPAFLFTTGEGALSAAIPSIAQSRGANITLSSLTASALLIGQVIGDIPAGLLVKTVGERLTMILGTLFAFFSLLIARFTHSIISVFLIMLVVGICTSTFSLARHAYITMHVSEKFRGRALSILGGVFRGGYFVGPVILSAVLAGHGSNEVAFTIDTLACVLTFIVIIRFAPKKNNKQQGKIDSEKKQDFSYDSKKNRILLFTLGVAVSFLAALRATRQIILPLVASHMGMPLGQSSLLIGIGNGIDFALFYMSGFVMDTYGRKKVAVYSLLGLALGHVAILLSSGAIGLVVVSLIFGLSNGMSSGVVNTIGSDAAPLNNTESFLGQWRAITDGGQFLGPILLSILTIIVPIGFAGLILGCMGLIDASILGHLIEKYTPKST